MLGPEKRVTPPDATSRKTRPLSMGDRLELRFSTGRTVDGLWIGTVESDAASILERIEQALALIRLHAPRRYQRLRRDLSRIWVRLLPGDLASFNAAARACELDSRYVRDDAVTAGELAASIVHEASHARIDRYIPYREDLRHRIEAACRRQELAFARRLPAGGAIQERTKDWLAASPPKEFWSDSAFEQRFVDGTLEALRHLGVPQRVLLVLRWLRRPTLAFRHLANGLTRRWTDQKQRPRPTITASRGP